MNKLETKSAKHFFVKEYNSFFVKFMSDRIKAPIKAKGAVIDFYLNFLSMNCIISPRY